MVYRKEFFKVINENIWMEVSLVVAWTVGEL